MPLAILFCFAPLLTTAEKLRKKVQKFSGDRQFGVENRWQVDEAQAIPLSLVGVCQFQVLFKLTLQCSSVRIVVWLVKATIL
jgi:hypothetical protein